MGTGTPWERLGNGIMGTPWELLGNCQMTFLGLEIWDLGIIGLGFGEIEGVFWWRAVEHGLRFMHSGTGVVKACQDTLPRRVAG